MQTKTPGKTKSASSSDKIDSTINDLLEKAVLQQATDVHIEPRERSVVIRFRINGALQEAAKVPLKSLDGVVANLKKRAGLDPKKTDAPQHGEATFASRQLDIALRIATLPTVDGEKVTVHLSPHISEPYTLESLGFWGEALVAIEQAAAEPHGLILATSPNRTGAGLTLLGVVHLLNNPALNVTTLEDPIEHHVAGVNQTQLDSEAGISFSTGLQAVLKQDPNVVMLSHLHERETIRLTLESAVNGQLMLGGLYTDSAAAGIRHLLQLHGEPFMVAAALRLALGQRFVRRLCPSCRESYVPDTALHKDLQRWLKAYGVPSIRALHKLEIQAAAEHIGKSGPDSFGSTETDIVQLWRADPNGCEHCRFTGVSGYVGVCEVIVCTDRMKKLIATNPSAETMQKLAISEGTIPLQVDALIKALRGLISLEEVTAMLAG